MNGDKNKEMDNKIYKQLRLKKLKHLVVEEKVQGDQKKEMAIRLANLIAGAIFLKNDEQRKEIWREAIPILTFKEMKVLSEAIIREDLRWKKRERNLQFEKLSQNPLSQIT